MFYFTFARYRPSAFRETFQHVETKITTPKCGNEEKKNYRTTLATMNITAFSVASRLEISEA